MLKKRLDYVFNFISYVLHTLTMNTTWRTYVFDHEINKDAHMMTTTKPEHVPISLSFLLMFHHRYANATHI